MKKIIHKAQGIPRTLNVLSDNALITGFGYQQKPVTAKIVKEIIRDLDGTERSSFARWWVPAAFILLLLVLVGFSWPYGTAFFHKMEKFFSPSQDELSQPVLSEINTKKLPEVNTQRTQLESNNKQTQSEEPLQTKTEQSTTFSKQETLPKKKTVVRGDTLTKLANEVYGKSDSEVLELVRDNNPRIADPNLIQAGSTIIFPDLPKQEGPGNQ